MPLKNQFWRVFLVTLNISFVKMVSLEIIGMPREFGNLFLIYIPMDEYGDSWNIRCEEIRNTLLSKSHYQKLSNVFILRAENST